MLRARELQSREWSGEGPRSAPPLPNAGFENVKVRHRFRHLLRVSRGEYAYCTPVCLQAAEAGYFRDSQADRSDLLRNAALKSRCHTTMISIYAA
ncbi:hypothetical protein DUI87_09939 [Hirundo rustica rustica]|uniref:Uncharacterized protein n=1 Tax=Hirundo rustica rustica TaxID=333673 RepID=A0A3M0KMF4_HIRRU|nr:hypothetical protein DUI87_09939 [Hirundo rustica rustica]